MAGRTNVFRFEKTVSVHFLKYFLAVQDRHDMFRGKVITVAHIAVAAWGILHITNGVHTTSGLHMITTVIHDHHSYT